MPPGFPPVVAAAPADVASDPEGAAGVPDVVPEAVVSEPLAGGSAGGAALAAEGASCRRVFDALEELVFFDVVVALDVVVVLDAAGVRVGDGVVAVEPEPEDGVATGVSRFGVVSGCAPDALDGAGGGEAVCPETSPDGGATVGTSGIGVAAGAGADDASGVGSGLCARMTAAPANVITTAPSSRQRFRIVSSFFFLPSRKRREGAARFGSLRFRGVGRVEKRAGGKQNSRIRAIRSLRRRNARNAFAPSRVWSLRPRASAVRDFPS